MKTRRNAVVLALYAILSCSAAAFGASAQPSGTPQPKAGESASSESASFELDDLVLALGVATFIVAASALSTGLYMKKNRKLLFPWHRRLGIATGVCALIHGIIAMLA